MRVLILLSSGDSGGPLILAPEGKNANSTCGKEDILVGITSTGIPCIDVRYGVRFPGIYTRITDFISWIEDGGGTDGKTHLNFDADECKGILGVAPLRKWHHGQGYLYTVKHIYNSHMYSR